MKVNRVSLVTGGGRGIGRAIALALARSGTNVAVVSRTECELAETVDLIKQKGGQATAFTADISDADEVRRMAEEVSDRLGPVDVLVNCAGRAEPSGPVWNIDAEAWWRCMEVNLRGPFLCTRAILPQMVTRGGGRIINITSGAALTSTPGASAYSTSKTALVRFSEVVAHEASTYGVKVFSVNPGLVRTRLTESFVQSEHSGKYSAWLCQSLKAGHDIPADRVANLVAFIASGKADELSGCNIGVYSDISKIVSRAQEIQERELFTLRLRIS